MENNRNFFITIALSVLILTVWQVFYVNPRIEAERETARVEQERIAAEQSASPQGRPAAGDVPAPQGTAAPGGALPNAPGETREAAVAATPRVKIETPSLSGSINLVGGRIDDVRLN